MICRLFDFDIMRDRGGERYNTITTTFGVLVARGGLKSSIPAIKLDTLRGGRKGDPQHECCGNYHTTIFYGLFFLVHNINVEALLFSRP